MLFKPRPGSLLFLPHPQTAGAGRTIVDNNLQTRYHSDHNETCVSLKGADVFSVVLQLILLVILILLNAFFAGSEIAVISLDDNKIKKQAEAGDKKAAMLCKLTANSSRFLSSIQVGVTLSGFLASAVAAQSFAEKLTVSLAFLPVSPAVINSVSVVVITLLLSFVTLVFGELVPKRIAMQKYEAFSRLVVYPLSVFSSVCRPFIWLLSGVTNLFVRLLGFDPDAEDESVTEEEIRMMVDVGEERGVIMETEKDMINNVLEFNDTTVGEIMTHRTEICAVDVHVTAQDVIRISSQEGYSRIPVYEEDLDSVRGIIYIKDFLPYLNGEIQSLCDLAPFIHEPYYVPESKRCYDLFNELKEKHVHMAIVVDEYGGTAGLVTMEDLLESIVGNIQDEFDNEEEEIVEVCQNTFTIDGTTDLEEVCDILDVRIPEGDYETIAGFVMSQLGRVPSEGEHPSVRFGNVTFTVDEIEDARIARLTAVKETAAPPEGTEQN